MEMTPELTGNLPHLEQCLHSPPQSHGSQSEQEGVPHSQYFLKDHQLNGVLGLMGYW